MRLPPAPAPIEAEILDFFASRNFERSRRFSTGAYDPAILRRWLELRGNPQYNYQTIHVAGTVGKGSITTYLSRALSVIGFLTGTYLSPHFVSLTERFVIAGEPIAPDELASAWKNLQQSGGPEKLSFFDAMTALAFSWFSARGCDWAVIETGLGGRLDSTNNLHAAFCVLTTIGLDHAAILGNSLAAIAAEKAGIIRPGQKVYCFPQADEAIQVIAERCRSVGASLTVLQAQGEDFRAQNQNFALQIVSDAFAPNADTLGSIGEALAEPVFGRWTELRNTPRTIFDSAHNEPALLALAQLVNRQPESQCNIFLNTMLERDLGHFASLLKKTIGKSLRLWLLPMPGGLYYERSPDSELLAEVDDRTASDIIKEPNALNIFTGSMGIYAELRRRFYL